VVTAASTHASLEEAWAAVNARLSVDKEAAKHRKALKDALELACSGKLRDSHAPTVFYSAPDDRFDAAF